jgi:hypothetical protein
MNGVPVPDARVERRYNWRWGEKAATDEVVTDKNGRFNMPEISASSMTAWLPHEIVIEQDVDVYVGTQKYQVWGGWKRSYKLNDELEQNGKPIKLRVELTAKTTQFGKSVGRFTLEP